MLSERSVTRIFTGILNVKSMSDVAIAVHSGKEVITTDSVIENVHFSSNSDPGIVGKYAVNVNLSDIAASGSIPKYITIALGLPPTVKKMHLVRLAYGMKEALQPYNVEVLGGDTKESATFFITITAIGIPSSDHILTRYGVKASDLVAVTGSLGKAGMYHYLWKKYGKKSYINELISIKPRVDEGIVLSRCAGVSTAMDLSDGLIESLSILSKLNGVGFRVNREAIPIYNPAKDLSVKENVDMEQMYDFGGDYELLFTVSPAHVKILERQLDFTVIGEVKGNRGVFYTDSNGKSSKAAEHSYRHFVS